MSRDETLPCPCNGFAVVGGRHLLLSYNPHVHLMSLAAMIHTLKGGVEKW